MQYLNIKTCLIVNLNLLLQVDIEQFARKDIKEKNKQ